MKCQSHSSWCKLMQETKGETALMKAIYSDYNVEVIKVLIEAGARINARNDDGWTPLHIADLGLSLIRL